MDDDKYYVGKLGNSWYDMSRNGNYNEYVDSSSAIGTKLQDMLEDIRKTEEKEVKMKNCEVCTPDGNGKFAVGKGSMFVTPAHNGFMLYLNPTGKDVEIHCFTDFDAVLKHMSDNKLLDITQSTVADNI